MPITPPWHPSSSWQPTEVTRFVGNLDSGAGTLIVETDSGLAYMKALGNPDGPHALVKEFLGTSFARVLGLPTFDFAIIEVTTIDELPFFRDGNAQPGPAFVTRSETGMTWGNDNRMLGKVDNPETISGLVVLDTWLRNTDRFSTHPNRINWDNVFFSTESESGLSLRAMDFSHCIEYGGELTQRVLSIDKIRDEQIYGLFPEFRQRITRDHIRRFASNLGNTSQAGITEFVARIPHEWELSTQVRNRLSDFLVQRASFVADSIENCLFDPPQLHLELSDGEQT